MSDYTPGPMVRPGDLAAALCAYPQLADDAEGMRIATEGVARWGAFREQERRARGQVDRTEETG